MQPVKDLSEQIAKCFSDDRKISNEHLQNVCKKNQGCDTCRYIVFGEKGFFCIKNTEHKGFFDNLTKLGQCLACGDNCPGLGIKNEKDKKE